MIDPVFFKILLENGDKILLESGDFALLENESQIVLDLNYRNVASVEQQFRTAYATRGN